MEKYPRVAIIYLSFYSKDYLDKFIESLHKLKYPPECLDIIVVDNFHPIHGSSFSFLQTRLSPLSGKNFPQVTILPQLANLGFSGGVNVGMRWAIEHGSTYVYLHNQDGYLADDALEKIVAVMEADVSIGAAQSLMMLRDFPEVINNSGNSFHYFGFGYITNFKNLLFNINLSPIYEIGYASGGAVLLRTDILEKYGLWDEDYFFYHEDLEYSLRLRSVGLKVVSVSASIFYHHYEFSRNKDKFYYMERNRLGLLLTYYRWPTLLLLIPVGIFLEMGVLFFSATHGWFIEKLYAYGYWFRFSNISKWLKKRGLVQTVRTQKDSYLLKYATGVVQFPEAGINTIIVKYFGNILSSAYFFIIKNIIFW